MSKKSFQKDNLVRVSFTLKDINGTLIDPGGLSFTFKDKAGVGATYVFGTDAQLVKDSMGNYHVDVDANKSGRWRYRWVATGTGQSAIEREFEVEDTEF